MEFYANKKVFITGGSSGIGLAAAELLAGWGAHVVIAARGQARLDEGLQRLESKRASTDQVFDCVAMDIGDKSSVAAGVEKALERLGGIDVLINNAGIAHPARFMETPDDVFESMMRVNYFGTVYVTRAFLPAFTAQRSGNICNVTSVLGFMGIYGYAAYAASKHAVTGFSDCLRQELIDFNVKLSVVFPPDTDTPQLQAENEIKPPETKAISEGGGLMQPESVAMTMLRGMARGKYHIVPSAMGRLTHFMYRHAPWAVRLIIDGDLKKYRKNHPDSVPGAVETPSTDTEAETEADTDATKATS